MLAASTALVNSLKKSLALYTKTQLIAEWNQNRYGGILDVDNWGHPEATYGADIENFPIGEIIKPNRPKRGLPKAFTNEALTETPDRDVPGLTRYHAMQPDAAYKYWIGPNQSDAAGVITETTQPYVRYVNAVKVNKIQIGFETSWSRPAGWYVDVTLDGTNWQNIATSPAIDADGRCYLYLQNNGGWSTTYNIANYTTIRGVRIRIVSLNQSFAHPSVIEISSRLRRDLSDYFISYQVDNNMDEPDFILPIGTVSANTGSVTLSNHDRAFDYDNSASLYFGLEEKHVQFEVSTGIDTTEFGGTGYEYVPITTMFADSWSGDTEIEVSTFDFATYLQDVQCPKLVFQNRTAGEIIWRLCDAAGFVDYVYNREDIGGIVVPYYWVTTDQTIWEAIREICRVTQTAIFFDQTNRLQILPRTKAFDKTKSVAWQLDAVNPTGSYADLIDFSPTWNLEANHVTVKFHPTDYKKDEYKKPATEIIWTPEEDQVVRSSALRKDMDANQLFVVLEQQDGAVWPFEGYINIEGELIKYKGKQYQWYDKTGNARYNRVDTLEQQRDYDQNQSNPFMAWANKYTGYLYVEERGVWDTYPDSHTIGLKGNWNTYVGTFSNSAMSAAGGVAEQRPQYSSLRIHTNASATTNNAYLALTGNSGATAYKWYGTRLKFDPSAAHGIAGLVFRKQGDGALGGYYLQVITTELVEARGRPYNEIKLVRINPGGGGADLAGSGLPMMIAKGVWYDIDVAIGGNNIDIMVNGVHAGTWTDFSGILGGGRLGLFAQGHSPVDFEYVYANNRPDFGSADEYGFTDKYRGGVVSEQGDKNHDYGTRYYQRKTKKHSQTVKQIVNYRFFDEFGPYCHEVRQYDVTFEKFPLQYSHPYLSNTSKADIIEYNSTPFGATFWVANTYREHAVIHGEDERGIAQQMFIYGRPIIQEDAQDYVVKDDNLILRRGKVPIEFDSDWLQTESAARSLGDWVVDNWANNADNATAPVFGNPLFQCGDVVSVNFPARSMLPTTHRYWITGVSQGWDNGPTTSLTLRRSH